MKVAIRSSSLFWFAALASALAWSQTPSTPNTPIQHVIVVIQENRTPDNLFGSDLNNSPRLLPGADLASSGQCKTANPTTIPLQSAAFISCVDPDHQHGVGFEKMYDNGKMDDVVMLRLPLHRPSARRRWCAKTQPVRPSPASTST